jgi:hypothetical protein
MTSMSRLQALPLAYCHEERAWYRGLTALDQTVVPVVKPDGFLTSEDLFLLDASLAQEADAEATTRQAELDTPQAHQGGLQDYPGDEQDTSVTQ